MAEQKSALSIDPKMKRLLGAVLIGAVFYAQFDIHERLLKHVAGLQVSSGQAQPAEQAAAAVAVPAILKRLEMVSAVPAVDDQGQPVQQKGGTSGAVSIDSMVVAIRSGTAQQDGVNRDVLRRLMGKQAEQNEAPAPEIVVDYAVAARDALRLDSVAGSGAIINGRFYVPGEELSNYPVMGQDGSQCVARLEAVSGTEARLSCKGQQFALSMPRRY